MNCLVIVKYLQGAVQAEGVLDECVLLEIRRLIKSKPSNLRILHDLGVLRMSIYLLSKRQVPSTTSLLLQLLHLFMAAKIENGLMHCLRTFVMHYKPYYLLNILRLHRKNSSIIFWCSKLIISVSLLGPKPRGLFVGLTPSLINCVSISLDRKTLNVTIAAILCLFQIEEFSVSSSVDSFMRCSWEILKANREKTYLAKLICDIIIRHSDAIIQSKQLIDILLEILQLFPYDLECIGLAITALSKCLVLSVKLRAYLIDCKLCHEIAKLSVTFTGDPITLFHIYTCFTQVYCYDNSFLCIHLMDYGCISSQKEVILYSPRIMLQKWTPFVALLCASFPLK